jgi:hypothetical protein
MNYGWRVAMNGDSVSARARAIIRNGRCNNGSFPSRKLVNERKTEVFGGGLLGLLATIEIGDVRLGCLSISVLEVGGVTTASAGTSVSIIQAEFRTSGSLVDMILTLPRAADSRRKMTSDLRSARQEWGSNRQGRRECENISS